MPRSVPPAVHLPPRCGPGLAPDEQRADPLGRRSCVAEKRHQVDLELAEITGICPSPARRRRGRRCRAPRQISPIAAKSWITPISLLTAITDTRIVSGRKAALKASGRSARSGARRGTWPRSPRLELAHVSSVALCSVLTVIDVLALLLVEVGGAFSARLIDSVAPESRRFPSGRSDQRRRPPRAVFDRLLGFQPNACDREGGLRSARVKPGVSFCATRDRPASSPNSRGRSGIFHERLVLDVAWRHGRWPCPGCARRGAGLRLAMILPAGRRRPSAAAGDEVGQRHRLQ